MDSDNDTTRTFRNALGGVLLAGLLWQIYVVFHVMRTTSTMQSLFSGLGAELPVVTTMFLSVYRWTFLLPIVSSGLALDLFRRPRPTPVHAVIVSMVVYGGGFGLLAWMQVAMFGPYFDLIHKIG